MKTVLPLVSLSQVSDVSSPATASRRLAPTRQTRAAHFMKAYVMLQRWSQAAAGQEQNCEGCKSL